MQPANSSQDGENAYILVSVKWKKIWNGIMELTDYLTKLLYLAEIPLRESMSELDHSGDWTWSIPLNTQKCKWLSEPKDAYKDKMHSAHTDMD